MSEWKTYKLGEIAEIIARGISPKYAETGVPVINQKCVRDGKIKFNDIKFNNAAIKKISKEKYLRKNDILVNSTGHGTLGRVGQINFEISEHTYDSHVTLIRIDKPFDPIFVGYKLKSLQSYIESMAEGSTGQTELNREKLRQLEITIPDFSTQIQIAQILTSLDDKIELNLQMNQTLETMAQALFKEWFVNFNFPNFDGELENDLPKGWRMGKLGEMIDVKGGTTPSTTKEEYWNGEFYWTTPKDLSNIQAPVLIDTERKITELGVKQISSGVMPKGTLLLSSRAPIGYIAISQVPISINQGYIAIQGKLVSNLFMLFWLKQNMDAVKSKANGSTFQEISKSNFREIETIIPSNEILKQFDEMANPVFEKIVENVFQIQALTQTRDTLLPKLMNGKIEIV